MVRGSSHGSSAIVSNTVSNRNCMLGSIGSGERRTCVRCSSARGRRRVTIVARTHRQGHWCHADGTGETGCRFGLCRFARSALGSSFWLDATGAALADTSAALAWGAFAVARSRLNVALADRVAGESPRKGGLLVRTRIIALDLNKCLCVCDRLVQAVSG